MSQVEISNAEWEVMRLLWSLGEASSKQLADLLVRKQGWKAATVKTLLGRLVNKEYVVARKSGRRYLYRAVVGEQATIDAQLKMSFDKICQRHAGRALIHVIQNIPLTTADIERLIGLLTKRRKTAPDTLSCNCLFPPQECQQEKPKAIK
ncbi:MULTISPECIES: CopY/TcrY family copper transport repressor [unclassified Ligilactobacillus]|uniref:CopY/TcrY family copper transport repressor n=1 Tax=unclassified Ligilactobacillus TaxID=2767920 RepID=UPI003852C690